MKQTVLHSKHVALGAKMAEFAGFDMPIQYTSIVEEHMAVRQASGVFDVSHMGNFFVDGSGARTFLQTMVTADIEKLKPNKAVYTLLCNPQGGAIDDLIVYCLESDYFMLIVNASNVTKDFLWLEKNKPANNVSLANMSDDYAIIALQGPDTPKIMDTICTENFSTMMPFSVFTNSVSNHRFIVARTGYTGEDGCEISVKKESAGVIWDLLVTAGAKPCGLGARDTLRLEMGYTLYGHEIDENTNVLEAGLGWVVDFNKPEEFVGKGALLKTRADGLKKKLVGLLAEDKGIPRQGCSVFLNDTSIGIITSGGHSPYMNRGIGLAMVAADSVKLGDIVEIDVRGRKLKAKVVKRKFIEGCC